MIKKLSQIWNYFKKGRSEIGLVLGLYSLMLSYSIKFDVTFSGIQYLLITFVFMVVCSFLGVFLARKVEPENNRINPYAQDGLKSAIHLQQAFIYLWNDDKDKALKEMNKAQELRNKWLK